ncbi:MAG: HAD family phosphatase [Bacteroidaceae bacterium]
MEKKIIKNVILDFGGVLCELHRQRCLEAFEAMGFKGVEHIISQTHSSGPFTELELGNISIEDFHDNISTYLYEGVSPQDIDNAWMLMLGIIPDAKKELLLKLKKDYRLFLLSNTNEIHWPFAKRNIWPYKEFQLEDYFEKVFLSYEMHLGKPDPAIFKKVLAETNIKAKETLFIDDSPLSIESAAKLGIQTHCAKMYEDWSNLFY